MILVVFGTRPEYIKLKPIIDEFKKNNINFRTLFTGQHEDLSSIDCDFSLKINLISENRLNNIIQNCLNIPEEIFVGVTHVMIQGDTSTVLGISINAFHRKLKIIYIESGLRTYDINNPFPEEINRQLTSRISNFHFCPTENNRINLLKENIPDKNIFVVGNTSLDNLLIYKKKCKYKNKVLITLHRRENLQLIAEWFKFFNLLSKKNKDIEFILPLHPNPEIKKHKNLLKNITVIDSLSHHELINILVECKLVITDSGGIQEECSFLNKKCIVCRTTTERDETLNNSSFLCKNPEDILGLFELHINDFVVDIESPFGNGDSSKKIINIVKNMIL